MLNLIQITFILCLHLISARLPENSTAYLPIENDLDETTDASINEQATPTGSLGSKVHSYLEMTSTPIQQIVERLKQLIAAIPDTIANFFVNLLSPFIDEDLIRERVVHFIHSLIDLIKEEFPKPVSQFFAHIGEWSKMIEVVG